MVTVRAHSFLALTLLHQPTEGEQWKEAERERGKPCPSLRCQNGTKWMCGVRGGKEGLKEEWGGQELSHTCRFGGSFERPFRKTPDRLSSTLLSFWNRGEDKNSAVTCRIISEHRGDFICIGKCSNMWKTLIPTQLKVPAESLDSSPEGCRTLNALTSLSCFPPLFWATVSSLLFSKQRCCWRDKDHSLILIWLRVRLMQASRLLQARGNSSRIAALQGYHIK